MFHLSILRRKVRTYEIPLTPNDHDLAELVRIHSEPSVSKYISISENYFEYVIDAKDVVYYKIVADGKTVGGIHCEQSGDLVYLSICIDAEHRRLGIAENALRQLFVKLRTNMNTVEISINDTIFPSIQLFKKLCFIEIGKEDELITYRMSFT